MNDTCTIKLGFIEFIPNISNEVISPILDAWKTLQVMLAEGVTIHVEDAISAQLGEFSVRADVTPLVRMLQDAARHEDGFLNFRQALYHNHPMTPVEVDFQITGHTQSTPAPLMHHTLCVALHQIYLAMNIAAPGSAHFPNVKFVGTDDYQIPSLDATPFIHAYWCATRDKWPPMTTLALSRVWAWLDTLKVSHTNTAIVPVNKVLFGLLEIAQSHGDFGLKEVLLIWNMLKLLTDTNQVNDPLRTRSRAAMLLKHLDGNAQDTLVELYRMQEDFVRGDYPTRRPALLCHRANDEVVEQLISHNSPTEEGLSVVVALLQQLILNNSTAFKFNETVTFS